MATDPKTGITYARCTKSELAGNIERRNDGTFPHRMNGKPCRCGTVHNDLNPGQKPIRRNGNGHGSNTKRKTVARYDYLDEEERLLNQVCRTNPKGFFQQRPDGADGWIRSLKEGEHYQTVDYETGEKVWYHVQATLDKGRTIPPDAPRKTFPAARRVLYHLSELLKADPSEIPFTTEWEKDDLNLESICCVATCNPEGAGKWHHVADHAR
ncbi:MAG TPA: hypothetical protein PK360_10270, partial [bacterium]|nr:hypothetical protein [bacterium]